MIEIYKDTKIYIVAPAGVATGGPEALHQLAYDLKSIFKTDKVFMYYLPINKPFPVHDFYKRFNISYSTKIENNKKNILIIPEVYTREFAKLKDIRKIIWWLSVDNYFFYSLSRIKSKINLFLRNFGFKHYFFFDRKLMKNYGHFAQSNYAVDFLKKRKIDAFYLFEYINQEYLVVDNVLEKRDIVVYNPKKGFKFTKKIINFCNDIKFVPIENMSQAQVIDLLKSAKVYIDFGNHPGRDRIPREAAILGCCVITGKRGAANFFGDVTIPENYKFSERHSDLLIIKDKIKECLINYDNEIRNFSIYRDKIRNEKKIYLSQIRDIFDLKY